MTHDVIIIGGGIAGLTCAIRCAEKGLQTLVISAGMNALHFSSGCIDLLGRHPEDQVVYSPFDAIPSFIAAHPRHPYAKAGPEIIKAALGYFQGQVRCQGLEYVSNEPGNHFHVTALGALKPTYLSPRGVFNENIKGMFGEKAEIAIFNFAGYRDFHPGLAAACLKKHPLFADCKVTAGEVPLPEGHEGPVELRSTDIARMFDKQTHLGWIADQIKAQAKNARFVAFPAFLGMEDSQAVLQKLQQMTGKIIYEVPTLPPSILGMRLDAALKSRFAALGGVFLAGDRVVSGSIQDGAVRSIRTKNNGATDLSARAFVLATGSFFSKGLASDAKAVIEPVFNLAVDSSLPRSTWYGPRFTEPGGHPFLTFGLKTDKAFHPLDTKGEAIANLYGVGAVLAHYNPVKEGSGSGVAITTGYFAAEDILAAQGRGAAKTHD